MVVAVDEHGADERGNGGKSAGKKSEREERKDGRAGSSRNRNRGRWGFCGKGVREPSEGGKRG